MTGPIDHYLDQLFDSLAGTGRAGRRALAEAEDHLRSAVADLIAEGVPDEQAQRTAVARFGDARRIAGGLRVAHGGIGALLRPVFSGGWLLAAIGLVAIGISGLLAELLGRVISVNFVAGDNAGVTYTPNRCGDFVEYFPGKSCTVAAELHHWGEIVEYRVGAGVLGLIGLTLYAMARRIGPMTGIEWAPPRGPLALVTVAVFGLAGALLTLPPVMSMMFGQTSGVGANLTGGAVALALSFGVAVAALRRRIRYTVRP